MTTLRFTTEHEWLRREDDGTITIGISDYAQEQLGDIVYVELPEVDADIDSGANLVVIESVKAVGEISMPIAGSIAAVNERLADEPEIVNTAPLGDGWLVRIAPADADAIEEFMDEADYQAFIAAL